MEGLWIALAAVGGTLAGGLLIGLAFRAQWAQAARKDEELKAAVQAQAVSEAKAARVEELQTQLASKEDQFGRLTEENAQIRESLQAARTQLEAERKALLEQRELLTEAERKLADSFAALSSEALRKNNAQFLELAEQQLGKFNEQAKGDLEKRRQAIDELIKPIGEKLKEFDSSVRGLEKELGGQMKNLLESERRLQTETGNLVRALRNPNQRGQWGEMQLERILNYAGLEVNVHYERQVTVSGGETMGRPDYVVRFATGQKIVIDSKAPLEAYLDAQETSDDDLRAAKLKEHAKHVRNHVQGLMKRAYQDRFDSLDFVIMFLPAESLFSAAVQHDPSLIEYGIENRVFIASPITLIGILRSVYMGWRQEQLAENAKKISEEAKELYARFGTVGKHFDRLGHRLDDAVEAFNETLGSMDTRLLPQIRRLKEMKVTTAEEIPAPSLIDRRARKAQSPELRSEAAEAIGARSDALNEPIHRALIESSEPESGLVVDLSSEPAAEAVEAAPRPSDPVT